GTDPRHAAANLETTPRTGRRRPHQPHDRRIRLRGTAAGLRPALTIQTAQGQPGCWAGRRAAEHRTELRPVTRRKPAGGTELRPAARRKPARPSELRPAGPAQLRSARSWDGPTARRRSAGSAALRPTSRRKPAEQQSAPARAAGSTEPTAAAGHGLAVPEQAQSEGPTVTPPPSRKRAPASAS